MIVPIINKSDNALPQYETPGSAGLDIRSNEDDTLESGEFKLIKTGLFIEIPTNYEIQVRSRSGLALKHGVSILNSPGTIDSDYRGEIGVILINHSKLPFDIKKGDRIAQLVLCSIEKINWMAVTTLTGTKRGDNGFGSTGK